MRHKQQIADAYQTIPIITLNVNRVNTQKVGIVGL